MSKITAKIPSSPDAQQRASLLRTLETANACANWLSHEAWNRQVFRQLPVHQLLYDEARERFQLSAQVVVRVFAKVADSYKLDRKSERRFSPHGAIGYDLRFLNFAKETVNLWTMDGRQPIPYSAGERQKKQLRSQQGESDRIYHRGKWFLAASCNIDHPTTAAMDEFLGVDLGIGQIASDGDPFSGSVTNQVCYRHRKLRKDLQAAQSKSPTRHLKKLAGKEFRFAQTINRRTMVEKAKRTGRGITIEKLAGIRERIWARKSQPTILHSWAFAQLGTFLKYQSVHAGVLLVEVDRRNSSRECSPSGYIEKANRPSHSKFNCRSCDYTANADFNPARILASRAKVNRPIAARILELQAPPSGQG